MRRRSNTENAAVVRIFIWYVTWNVAASRLDAATYCKLFCKTYNSAGIPSFQQSGLKISRKIRRNGLRFGSTRRRAITNEIEPFRSSLSSTADAAEYCREGGVIVRDVCMMSVRAAFWTASVTSLSTR